MSLIDDIKREEGFRACAYQDHLGYWTVGHGILIDDRVPGAGITEEESEWLLSRRLEKYRRELADRWGAYTWQPPHVKDALLNMAYQMGVPKLLGFKRMLAALEANDYDAAARHALDSAWADQTPQRAARVAAQIEKGV